MNLVQRRKISRCDVISALVSIDHEQKSNILFPSEAWLEI